MLATEDLLLTGGNVEISAAGKMPIVIILVHASGLVRVSGKIGG